MMVDLTSRGKPSRELSIGEVLGETFALYSQNFTRYIIPFLVAGAITGLLTTWIGLVITIPAALPATATRMEIMHWLPGYLSAVIAFIFLTGMIGWIIGYMAQAISIKFASDTLEKGQADLVTSFNFGASKILSILGASIITGVLISIGMIALVIPGLILMIMFSLVVPTIVIENTGALESLSRSRRLVSNRWLKTFGLLLILYIIIGIVDFIASLISAPFGLSSTFISYIIVALIQPILPIGLTLYYYSMMAKTPKAPLQPQIV